MRSVTRGRRAKTPSVKTLADSQRSGVIRGVEASKLPPKPSFAASVIRGHCDYRAL